MCDDSSCLNVWDMGIEKAITFLLVAVGKTLGPYYYVTVT